MIIGDKAQCDNVSGKTEQQTASDNFQVVTPFTRDYRHADANT
jgi:hypothetical protein